MAANGVDSFCRQTINFICFAYCNNGWNQKRDANYDQERSQSDQKTARDNIDREIVIAMIDKQSQQK
jgi:hypothetical protein